MDEAVFEALDAGVALARGADEAALVHLLGDVLEHVPVLEAASQRELHAVAAPDLQQGARLVVRPRHLPAQVGQQVVGRRLLV